MIRTDGERLEQYFSSLSREKYYEVEEILKDSPNEMTQRVSFLGADGTTRVPLVRKFIKRESGMGLAYERLFEAQQAGQRFKHVPRIWECYANDDDIVVVMEYVAGYSLDDYVARQGASVELARNVFPRLCAAVRELHEDLDPPLIHRDLKPSNIIVTEQGLAIIDFGIARDYRDGARTDTVRFGTCSFAPPEQFGFGQTTVRSDVFALGMVLFFSLTGGVPDTYVSEDDVVRGDVPSSLRAVVLRATALDPANRYATVRDMEEDFFKAVADANAGGKDGGVVSVAPGGSAVDDGARGPVGAGRPIAAASAVERAASDHSRDEIQGAREPERFTFLGKMWNGFLVVGLVLFLIVCVGAFIAPSEEMARYPQWVNAWGYLFLLPVLFATGAWVVADKRRLARRFPRLQRYRFWHWLILFVVAFVIMFTILGTIGVVADSHPFS